MSAVLVLVMSSPAMATNGYFTHGVGTESKGMAGTGVGSNAFDGSIIVASNPALGVFAGDNWELGMSLFSPRRSYKASSSLAQGQGGAFTIGEGSFDSGSEWFPIPYISKNWRLQNGNAVTFAFYGRGGMNTDWSDSGPFAITDPDGALGPAPVMSLPGAFGGGEAGVDLSQAFLAVNYAGKSGDNFAWGIGPVFAIQAFEAKGLVLFSGFTETYNESGFTVFPTDTLTDNGHEISTGLGAAIGFWWALSDSVSMGLSYQSKLSMSEFDDYSDLFAEDGGFDIPASTKLGLSFAGNGNTRVNFDIEHTQFSDVASVGNPMANILGCPAVVFLFTGAPGGTPEACLGGDVGAGFGWEDMTTYKVGVEWQKDESTIWRFGFSYGEQPIPEADVLFNILAPGVMEQHLTFGMSKNNWNFSLMYAPSKTIEGLNMFDPTQTIELEMKQLEFEFSYAFK
ncbi:MAG: hypothetical protein GWN47_03020 [Woeseiaceae bacterium]|nr:hypothetical protein [Woeseiaceae bacterium]